MSKHPSKVPTIEELAELLPQYGIDSFIAHGGMGAVYRGRQLSLDREVAIKVLLTEFGEDAAFRESFTTEARAMARLNHPNLLGVHDYGDINGMPYIVMEYVEGGSLHEAAWNTAIEPLQAVEIVNGICKGLAHAHENGIIHRDIKPANILLTLKAEPKVADFGLAHATDAGHSGVHMGTPGFTAPEVFNDPNQAGELADIYSVGIIFHQLLTGLDHTGSMEPPTHATGNLHLDAIWRKATHINPSQRYMSVSAMSSDLEKWVEAKRVVFSAAPSITSSPFYTRNHTTQTKASTGDGMTGKLIITGILLAALGITYLFIKKEDPEDKENIVDNEVAYSGDFADPDYIPGLDQEPEPEPEPKSEPEADSKPTPTPDSTVKTPTTELPTNSPEPETETKEKEPEVANKKEEMNPTVPAVVKVKPEKVKDIPPGDPALLERGVGLIRKAHEKRIQELSKNDISHKKAIDEAYYSELNVIRSSYVSRLEKAAGETPDEQLKQRLQAQAKQASDLDAWVALLASDLKEPPAQEEPPAKGADSVIGNWDQSSEGKVERWIAHADGRMEIVGKAWEVKWRLEEDGTLIVDWKKIRPYIYTRDGDGWTGKSTFGQPTSLKRGDW